MILRVKEKRDDPQVFASPPPTAHLILYAFVLAFSYNAPDDLHSHHSLPFRNSSQTVLWSVLHPRSCSDSATSVTRLMVAP